MDNLLLDALIQSNNQEELQQAIAALEEHLARCTKQITHTQTSSQCMYPVIKSVLVKMVKVTGEASMDRLLRLADACFSHCHNCCGDESHLVLLYSYMKRLTASNRIAAALSRGQQLLSILDSLDPVNSSSSTTRKDLLLGAGLSVLMCHCKLPGRVLGELKSINTAACAMLQALWQASDQAAVQHGDALCDVLLQLNSLVGKEISCSSGNHNSSSGSSTQQDLCMGIVALQQQLLEAVTMSSKAGMLPKLAVEAAAALPNSLRHCSIMSMLAAARRHGSSSTAGIDRHVPSVSLALLGMQAVLQSMTSQKNAAAACVRGLVAFKHPEQQMGLETNLLAGLMCCCNSNLDLQLHEVNSIIAQIQSAVTTVQLQASASAAAGSNPAYGGAAATAEAKIHLSELDTRALDTLTNKVANISLSGAKASRSSSRSSSSSNRAGKKGSAEKAREVTACSKSSGEPSGAAEHMGAQLQSKIAAFQIELAVWCLQQLIDAGAPDDTLLAPLFITYVTGVISIITALHSSSCYVQPSSSTISWGIVARAAAMAAGVLKQLPISDAQQGSAAPGRIQQSSSSDSTGGQLHQVSKPPQLLQHFTAAVQLLIGVANHCEEPSTDLHSGSGCSSSGSRHSRLSSKELQWLSWQLYSCALEKDTASNEADSSGLNSSSNYRTASPSVVEHLLLLAWQCTKVQLCHQADRACSGSTAAQCCPLDAAKTSPAAVLTLLQQAYAYFNCILSSTAACSAAAADASATTNLKEAPGAPVEFQHGRSVQLVALQTVSVALQHSTAATAQHQAQAEQLQLRLQKVLKMYSRLRCTVAAVAEPSKSGSSNNAGRSGTGSRRQRVRIQQQQQQEMQHPQASREWLLQSAVQLLLHQEHQQQQQSHSSPPSNSSRTMQESIPVLYLAWLESKALLSIAEDSRCPGRHVAAIAVQELLDQLCSCQEPSGCDAVVLQASTKLLQGMVLCSGHNAFDSAGADSKKGHSKGVSSSSAALSALSESCQNWSSLLLHLEKSGACGSTSAVVAPKRSGRGAVKGRAEAASSESGDNSSGNSEVVASPDPVNIAQALTAELGADAAAGTLMLAALSHCTLALLQANAAAKQNSSIQVANSATAATAAGGCLKQQEPQDAVDPEWVCSTDEAAADTAEVTRAAVSNPGELIASACKLLHTCADLFTAMQHAACASSCSSNPLGVCSCFAPEAAVLALQAWHVAGLQGWSSCQAALGEAVALLTQALPAQLQAELHHMQQLVMPLKSDCGMTWLGLLLAPQHLLLSPVSDSSGCCSSSHDGSSSTAGTQSVAASNGRLQTAAKMPKRGTAAMAAAPAVEPACNCVCYCGCRLQSGTQDIAAAQQSHSEMVNMHAGARDALQLQRALLLLADSHAASALGNVTAALTCAEKAVDICRGIIAAAGSASSSGRLQSDAVSSSIRHLQPSSSSLVHGIAISLYMSALWHLSEVIEVSGNPTDSLRALKQLLKLSAASSCSCFTALALLKLSATYFKMGDDDKAVTTAAVAADHVQQFQQQQKLVPAHHLQLQQWQQSVLCVYVAVAGLQAEAGCKLVSAQHDAAQQQLGAAIQLLDQSIAAAPHGKQQQDVCMMLWRAVDLRAKLQLQLAHILLITAGHATAVRELRRALEHLDAASTCSRCNLTAWPAAHAALQLQLLAWCCPDRPASQPSSTILQLIGFGSSSSHCDLQAEFACAAAEEDTAYHSETAAAAGEAAACSTAPKTSRAASRASVKTSRGSGSSSSRRRNGKACDKSQLPPSDAAGVHPAIWMSQLLMLLPACVGQPMLLHDACCMLRSFLLAHDVLQGAALMLQLSLGVSITQQQLLAACRKMSQAQAAEQLQPAGSAEAAEEAPADGCQDEMSCRLWQQVQQQLNLQPLLVELASIAREACAHGSSSSTNGRAGASRLAGSPQLLLDLFSRVDSVATRWLARQRDGLLPCTAVCSLMAVGADASTPFGATAVDGGWHPLVTPAAAALAVPAPAAGSSLLICRMLPAVAAATDAVAGVHLNMLPLLVLLQPSTRSDDGCSVTLQQSLAELSSILSESSASMQHSVKCTTAAQKAKWWKQRVALDARMGALLQQLDGQWLGPWRCLLMQPGLEHVEAAAAAAASTFVADYFEFIFEERPRQLLAQLAAVLLVHLDAVGPSERQQAVRDLCQLTQQRADGLHLSKLLSGLEDAHAAVAAAAAAATKQPRRLDAEPAASSPPCQAGSGSLEAAIASDMPAAAAVYVTPAAPKARSRLGGLRQGTASARKPQSRLKAMQQGSSGAASTAADAVTEAGVSSLADMLSDQLQVGAFNKHEAGDADVAAVCSGRLANCAAAVADESRADAASQPQQRRRQLKHAAGHEARRVRFAADQGQEHENPAAAAAAAAETTAEKAALDDAGVSSTLAVPASLARHAARRSRLAVMHSTPSAASHQVAAGDSSTSDMSVKVHAHAAAASNNKMNASSADNSRTPAKVKSVGAAATGSSAPLQQQQQQHWVPSVLLLLDNQLQQLPWESLLGLKQQNMYRCPSLSFAAAIATRHTAAQHARCSGANSSSSSSSRPRTADSLVQQQHALCHVRLHDGYFLLNPDGDLQATQDTFEGWLQQLGLQGVSGSRPAAAHLKSALLSHDLFLYFGHGAGEQYVPLTALKQLDRCAAAVLMGCSSGRLNQLGLYEPSGAMWGYLLAGCPAAVANLWDVTDRDIDRFAQALIQQWTGSSSSSSSDGSNSASSSNDGTDLHATGRRGSSRFSCDGCAQQKTSQSLDEGVTVGRDGLLAAQSAASSGMSTAVTASRQACRLPSLIGAAAVCYGLPAYVDA